MVRPSRPLDDPAAVRVEEEEPARGPSKERLSRGRIRNLCATHAADPPGAVVLERACDRREVSRLQDDVVVEVDDHPSGVARAPKFRWRGSPAGEPISATWQPGMFKARRSVAPREGVALASMITISSGLRLWRRSDSRHVASSAGRSLVQMTTERVVRGR